MDRIINVVSYHDLSAEERVAMAASLGVSATITDGTLVVTCVSEMSDALPFTDLNLLMHIRIGEVMGATREEVSRAYHSTFIPGLTVGGVVERIADAVIEVFDFKPAPEELAVVNRHIN